MENSDREWGRADLADDADEDGIEEERLPVGPVDGNSPRRSRPENADTADLDLLGLYLRDTHEDGRNGSGAPQREGAIGHTANGRSAAEDPDRRTRHDPVDLRRRMIEKNLGLVISIACSYQRLGEQLGLALADLIQEGNLGLMAAARRFTPAKNGQFSRYAAGRIRQAICRALSHQSRVIHIPFRRLELRRHAAQVEANVDQRCGNGTCNGGRRGSHTEADDARELGVSVEELRATIRLVPDVASLDAPAPGDGRPRRLSLPDSRSPDPCEEAARSEQHRHVCEALSRLPDRLRRVLENRYGLTDGKEAGLAEIGQKFHLSAERVRQLQKKALKLLREDPALREAAH